LHPNSPAVADSEVWPSLPLFFLIPVWPSAPPPAWSLFPGSCSTVPLSQMKIGVFTYQIFLSSPPPFPVLPPAHGNPFFPPASSTPWCCLFWVPAQVNFLRIWANPFPLLPSPTLLPRLQFHERLTGRSFLSFPMRVDLFRGPLPFFFSGTRLHSIYTSRFPEVFAPLYSLRVPRVDCFDSSLGPLGAPPSSLQPGPGLTIPGLSRQLYRRPPPLTSEDVVRSVLFRSQKGPRGRLSVPFFRT